MAGKTKSYPTKKKCLSCGKTYKSVYARPICNACWNKKKK